MPNYQQGKIYTIRCRTDDTLIYVGSTIQPLCERFAGHKRSSRNEKQKNTLIYRTINGDWDNWYIELYELYPCSCKNELERKEGEVIRLIGNLNTNITGRTVKEWREIHKEELAEKYKLYREANKEKFAERHKLYYEANKEELAEHSKAYYEANKEEKLEYQKIYREVHKEKLAEYKRQYYQRKKQDKQENK